MRLLFRGTALPDRAAVDRDARAIGGDRHRLTVADLAGQNQLGERVLHFLLDDAL